MSRSSSHRSALGLLGALTLALLAACASDQPNNTAASSKPAPPPAAASKPAPSTPAATSTDDAPPSRAALRIRFGIKPGNYDDGTEGVFVEDVYEGTSAADAGIKPEDRMMTWNGKKIADVRQWMEYMMPANPGDVVEVGVLRAGKTVPLKVTLKAAG